MGTPTGLATGQRVAGAPGVQWFSREVPHDWFASLLWLLFSLERLKGSSLVTWSLAAQVGELSWYGYRMLGNGGRPVFPGLIRHYPPAVGVLLLTTPGNMGMCGHPARPDRDIVDRYGVRMPVPLLMRVSQDKGRRIEDRLELRLRPLCDIQGREQGPWSEFPFTLFHRSFEHISSWSFRRAKSIPGKFA